MGQQPHKAGFVSIVGNPNVGKSTLMNALVGEKLSIVTSKMQTTRHRIRGIVNGDDYQVVFSDTPGILEVKYKLHEAMMQAVSSSLSDADALLFMTDIYEEEHNVEALKKIMDMHIPMLVLVNKVDQADKIDLHAKLKGWEKKMKGCKIMPVSALKGMYTDEVMQQIVRLLPEFPPYFPKDELTDRPERFFISEIIRGKILEQYKKEIPYAVEVVIEEFKEEEKIVRIRAIIYVERESQKGIIIGHQGKALKAVGISSRKDMEEFLGKQVFLETYVKVAGDWRKDAGKLKGFGY